MALNGGDLPVLVARHPFRKFCRQRAGAPELKECSVNGARTLSNSIRNGLPAVSPLCAVFVTRPTSVGHSSTYNRSGKHWYFLITVLHRHPGIVYDQCPPLCRVRGPANICRTQFDV